MQPLSFAITLLLQIIIVVGCALASASEDPCRIGPGARARLNHVKEENAFFRRVKTEKRY